jgi:hypothetical protein
MSRAGDNFKEELAHGYRVESEHRRFRKDHLPEGARPTRGDERRRIDVPIDPTKCFCIINGTRPSCQLGVQAVAKPSSSFGVGPDIHEQSHNFPTVLTVAMIPRRFNVVAHGFEERRHVLHVKCLLCSIQEPVERLDDSSVGESLRFRYELEARSEVVVHSGDADVSRFCNVRDSKFGTFVCSEEALHDIEDVTPCGGIQPTQIDLPSANLPPRKARVNQR